MDSFGTPATITTDRGAQFESKLWDNLSNQFGIVRNRTTSYHPQSTAWSNVFSVSLSLPLYGTRISEPVDYSIPAVLGLLSVRSAVKELLDRSAAEMARSLDCQSNSQNSTPSTNIQTYTIFPTSYGWPCRASDCTNRVTHHKIIYNFLI